MTTLTGSITSANNASNLPSNDGVLIAGPFDLYVAGGSTISAALQRKFPGGTWRTIPDANDAAVIDGADTIKVSAVGEAYYRISVTTATGTWEYEFSPGRPGRI